MDLGECRLDVRQHFPRAPPVPFRTRSGPNFPVELSALGGWETTLVVTTTSASVKKWRTKPKPRKIQTETTSEPAQDEPVLYSPADLETMLAVRSGGYDGDPPCQNDAEVPQETRVIDGLQLRAEKAVQVAPTYDTVSANPGEYKTCKLVQPAKTPKKKHDRRENPVFHPDKKGNFHDRNGNVPDIDGRFSRTAIALAIEIAVEFTHGNKKHTSSVQWLFGPVYDHETDKQVRCIIPGSDVITQHLDGEMPYIEIKFQLDFAVGTKLDPPSDFSLTDYDKFMVQQLKNFCDPKKTHPVHLWFYIRSKEVTELKEQNSTGYKKDSGEVQAIANQMKGRSAIISKGTPLEAHPAVARFIDAPHGLLTLANGHHLDHRGARQAACSVQ
ncbi:hypothetical protein LTR56_024330 [Elasticomyces elasticus]|nr:hypothetical protein LTR56_024330 [Elasticomyces elasticus]KAK3646903.1 hypothetical protein LTR22_014056 [Elasticomyces elasticus]KAK4905811.1 hypothetical protein LTR49_024951 [Elasticomyces elasticus]KAK5750324.1 hypothetical protein LTS12_019585 [Elasticomyces elasticus]